MKKSLLQGGFIIAITLAAMIFGTTPAEAICSLDRGSRQFQRRYELRDSGSPQCAPPNNQPNGTYTVWCDTQQEANAADSVRQPLCGSSIELGAGNSVCWGCGGNYFCSGLGTCNNNMTLACSDDVFNSHRGEAGLWLTESELQQIRDRGGFTYNGLVYSPPPGGLYMCDSNVTGCLATCTDPAGWVNLSQTASAAPASCQARPAESPQCAGQEGSSKQPELTSPSCPDDPGGSRNIVEAPEHCDSGQTTVVGTVPYIVPCSDKTKEESTCFIMGSSFPKTGQQYPGGVPNKLWGETGVDGQQYVFQRSGDESSQTDKHLLYKIDGGMIRLVEDTTWANVERCGSGGPARQWVYTKEGSLGGNFAPTSFACGGRVTNDGFNRAFPWSHVHEEPGHILEPTDQCENVHAGQLGSTSKLIFQGQTMCMGETVDAIAMQVVEGAGLGEVLIFCKNKGLCAWYQEIDFTVESNLPKNWKNQDVCAGLTGQPVCKVRAKFVHEDIPINRVFSFAFGALPNPLASLFVQVSNIGTLKVDQSKYHTGSSRLNQLASQIQSASLNLLTSDRLQKQTISDTPKNQSMRGRVCVYHPITGELVADVENNGDAIATSPVFHTAPAAEASERLRAYVGRGQKKDQNFKKTNLEIENPSMPCPSSNMGAQNDRSLVGANRLNSFGTSAEGADEGGGTNIVGSVISIPIAFGDLVINFVEGLFRTRVTVPSHIEETVLSPHEEKVLCYLGGCTTEDLAEVPDGSNVLGTTTNVLAAQTGQNVIDGFVQSFRPERFDPKFYSELHANNPQQAWNQTITNSVVTSGTNHQFQQREEAAGNFLNCILTPQSIQPDRLPGNICENFKVPPTPTPLVPREPPLPTEMLTCNESDFSKTHHEEGGGNGGPIGDKTGYTIPYRDSSCTLNSDSGPRLADYAIRWLALEESKDDDPGNEGQTAERQELRAFITQNITSNWQNVQRLAQQEQWNPAFAITLWIEESAAGGAGTWQMGCKAGWVSEEELYVVPRDADACTEAACLFSHKNQDPNDFQRFMCSYNTGVCANTKISFPEGWTFAQTIKKTYADVMILGNVPVRCKARTTEPLLL